MIERLGIKYLTPNDLKEFFGVETDKAVRQKAIKLGLIEIKLRVKEEGDERSRYYYPYEENLPILKGLNMKHGINRR